MKLTECTPGMRVRTIGPVAPGASITGTIETLEPGNSGFCNTLVRLDQGCPRRGDLWAMAASDLRPL